MVSIKDKIVFISGASSGIGEACAVAFAKQGCRLIICARSRDKLEATSTELSKKYKVSVLPVQLDVRDRKGVESAIANLPSEWKKIDVLVNNAGLAAGADKVHEANVDDWEQMIDTNIKGLLYLTRVIVPMMLKEKTHGHIINIGSIAGIIAYPNGAVYCATKAAVKFISDGLRMDLVDTPIKVTNVQPGMVETNFSSVRFKGDKAKADKVYEGIEPLSGHDIADAVVYAATAPQNVQIAEITIMPVHQAAVGVVHRSSP
jgi:3-hydroxy acid dehydrogenase / malonic semialdehyde reductase